MHLTDAVADAPARGADDGAAPPEPALGGRRVPGWWSRPWAHVALLALVLVGVALIGDRSDSWTADDGAYALQVRTIEETGGWSYPYRHADIDPDRVHLPFSHGLVTEDGAYPYVKLPAWIVVLRASTWVFGDVVGLYVPSMAGVLAAAAVAWWLARKVDAAAAPFAFWAVGLGALLVVGTAMWAHTVAAALAGLCAGWVLDAGRGRRVPPAGVPLALAAMVLVRNEGLFFAAATVLVLAVVGLARPGPMARRMRAAAVAAGPGAAAVVAALLVTRAWRASIIGGASDLGAAAGGPDATAAAERVASGAVRSLVDGAGDIAPGTTFALLALVLVGVAGWAVRSDLAPAWVAGPVLAGLALMVARTLQVATWDLAGLLLASPLLVLGAAAVPWSSLDRGARAVVAQAALFSAAVLATQYPEGGSREWGGRFFLPVLVVGIVGSVVVLRRWVLALPRPEDRRLLAGVLAATVVVPTVLGVYATADLRQRFGSATARAVAVDADVVVRTPDGLGRLSWRVMFEEDWMAAHEGDVDALLVALEDRGVGTIAVVGFGAEGIAAPAGLAREEVDPDLVVFRPVG